MLGTFILYAVLTGLMLSLGWISWSTPAFMFVAFVPLWVAAYKIKRAGARHGAWIMLMMSAVAFGVWNAVDTFWLKNATWAGFFIASGANTAMMSIVMMLSYFVMRRRGMTVGLVFWIALWVSFEKMHTRVGTFLAVAYARQRFCQLRGTGAVVRVYRSIRRLAVGADIQCAYFPCVENVC